MVDDDVIRYLDRTEGLLYCADTSNTEDQPRGENAYTELMALSQGDVEFGFQVISLRARTASPEQRRRMIKAIDDGHRLNVTGDVFGRLVAFIDTHQMEGRQ